ncbi:GNAT family N-acetyltransferase [Methylobacterium isbiliense]|jgi:ribosomal protein S18 acetylase RimI-like enzyme|uniref:N-acetyltransferase domain-containing protein n=1 Tax=Methylobacterium isbiliense TaxID=315478 RepID=A0ABQ4SRI4_9HYPH|nr:GNAT family N-acetyltransferase [Methylobacterium isbiliense]MDN3627730.1 GNAT family N-acetyltransferase [Methylobacterium isbiliense]GJE04418.1 hypothetical protein GMJLKIPL_6382 [Methylobacterium isbiliense]
MASLAGSIPLAAGLGLRLAAPADEPFLLQLFRESRPWLAWAEGGRDFVHALYEQQYRTLRAGLEAHYPEHLDFVIERTGQAAGRLIVDLGYADWRLSELQVLAAARGRGIGSDVVRSLQAAAGSRRLPITLATPMLGATGKGVYERLGFRVTAVRPPHYEMAWHPPGLPGPGAAAAPGGARMPLLHAADRTD